MGPLSTFERVWPFPSSRTICDAGLGEAGELRVDGLLETGFIWLEGQGASEEVGVFCQQGRVRRGYAADGGYVLLDASFLEAGLDKILGGSNEGSWTAAHRGFQGLEVATRLWREEHYRLLRVGRNGHVRTLGFDLGIPGLDTEEPVLWGRVGVAAEEDADEEVVDGLGGREVGVYPELIAGLQVGNHRYGERLAVAGNADVNLGPDQIEA